MKTELIEKILELALGEKTVKQQSNLPIGGLVIVRARNAGVHIGTLKSFDGDFVELNESHRLWSWEGAFTLSQVANDGITGGKVGCEIDLFIPMVDVGEIIPIKETAFKSIKKHVTTK